MSTLDRIGNTLAVTPAARRENDDTAAAAARGALSNIGERVLAWTAANSGGIAGTAQWSTRTGVAPSGFSPDQAELGRRGDVYELRALTSGIAQQFGASPAAEGALGRAVEDFARATALHFNGRGGSDGAVEAVASRLDAALAQPGPDGIEGVTTRIETAARMVEDLNR